MLLLGLNCAIAPVKLNRQPIANLLVVKFNCPVILGESVFPPHLRSICIG